MTELPISLAKDVDGRDAEKAIDAAIAASGLRVTLRSTLAKFPGSIHWHLKHGRERGTLEITLWPRENRAWFSVQDGRRGEWIEQAMKMTAQFILNCASSKPR